MSWSRKKSKGTTKYKIQGRTTSSDFEYEIYNKIRDILPRKCVVEYEAEKIPYVTEHVYKPDFIITKADGSKVYIETKGAGRSWTPTVMQKMLTVRDQHPDKDIRILFYRDAEFGNRRKDGTRKKQSEWATEKKFKFAIKELPEEWITE